MGYGCSRGRGQREAAISGGLLPASGGLSRNDLCRRQIPGGFFKREGRPTLKEVLTGRLMDRPIRPLFPENYLDEVMVTGIVLSADRENDPDILSLIGGSAALTVSPRIPFLGPVGAVRVGKLNGEFILNPTAEEREKVSLELVIAGTESAVTMLEARVSKSPRTTCSRPSSVARNRSLKSCASRRNWPGSWACRRCRPAGRGTGADAASEAKYFDQVMPRTRSGASSRGATRSKPSARNSSPST